MSEVKKVEVEVSKEAHELGEGIQKFVKAARQALADGWQPGQDLPVILSSALSDLAPALQGAEKIAAEQADKQAFANAVYLSLSPIAFDFIK